MEGALNTLYSTHLEQLLKEDHALFLKLLKKVLAKLVENAEGVRKGRNFGPSFES